MNPVTCDDEAEKVDNVVGRLIRDVGGGGSWRLYSLIIFACENVKEGGGKINKRLCKIVGWRHVKNECEKINTGIGTTTVHRALQERKNHQLI